ncbi:MAG: hypothetical protein GX657_09880 [Chloroflexi bacterium]|nr:hypothetical protein [Chloroflexota bacterium]
MATLFERTATEWIVREVAPSGAEIHQLTSCPAINDHEYFEVPYMDASSRYVFFTRHHDSVGPTALWRADLERRLLSRVAECRGRMRGQGVSPDQRFFYYIDLQEGGGAYTLFRLDMATLESSSWEFDGALLPRTRGSVTPDGRYYINSAYLGNRRFGLWRCDLQTGERRVIWEAGQDMCNAHPQVDPAGTDIMIQHNRGAVVDDDGRMVVRFGEIGKTIYLIDIEGQNHRTLPWGKPFTRPTMGHQSWIGPTYGILSTVSDRREATNAQLAAEGNLLALWPGEERPVVVGRGYAYDHVNSSRDGRFWVGDEMDAARLVVGSLRTGRSTLLCETGSSLSTPQYTHPHPYYSPDNKWVIYNSDRTGIPHVYAARLPEGLLESLD